MITTTQQRSAPIGRIDELLSLFFPLVLRARPVCRPLPARIAHVEDVLRQAQQTPPTVLLRAAEAHNFAALIASDCGLPDLARDLCLRQYTAIQAAGPVDIDHAKLTLQPLINLGRLHTRDGDGGTAYQLLHDLFTAVQNAATARIDGIHIDAADLVSEASRPELVQWLWAVLLADGTRALARAGRWGEAAHHAEQHHGIGTRLLDGRQVAIIAAPPHAALGMLHATDTPTPWERAVAACLTTVCHARSQHSTDTDIAALLDAYQALDPGTTDAAFRARLTLTATALAADRSDAAALHGHVERLAADAADAYIGRDILTAAHLVPLTSSTVEHLTTTVTRAGLGVGTMPPALMERLLQATGTAEHLISGAVVARP